MRRFVLPLIIIMLAPLSTWAQTEVELYNTSVVMSEEANAEQVAWQQGLMQVLIKASANGDIAANPVIKKSLSSSTDYLSQFEVSLQGDQRVMQLQFNAPSIQELLVQSEQHFWPAKRKDILVWLVEQNGFARTIIWQHSDSAMEAALMAAAQKFALPIVLPIGDASDTSSIRVPDLWGNFMQPISRASERYAVDAVLVLKVENKAQQVTLSWQLYDQTPQQLLTSQQGPMSGELTANNAASVADAVIEQVSQHYANKNQLKSQRTADESLYSYFSGVTTAQAAFGLERKLQKLDSVASCKIVTIQGDTLGFKIELLASVEQFEREVLASRGVTKYTAPQPVGTANQVTDSSAVEGMSANTNGASVVADSPVLEVQGAAQPQPQHWFELK